MRIAKLHMDAQDKTRFEIHGKSSVKYHLKANHVVEAKRWFWSLNNAIQWAKDEAREEERQKTKDAEMLRQAKIEQIEKHPQEDRPEGSAAGSIKAGEKGLASTSSLGVTSHSGSKLSPQSSRAFTDTGDGDEEKFSYIPYGSTSVQGDLVKPASHMSAPRQEELGEEDSGEYASSNDVTQPSTKDAFNITAQSAKLQLDLLRSVSAALQAERKKNPLLVISDASVTQALTAYEGALSSLDSLVAHLLKISQDRDAYWQYRLDREADARRMWEESMAHVAREHEELQNKIGESEERRRRTKKALKETLEASAANHGQSLVPVADISERDNEVAKERPPLSAKTSGNKVPARKPTTLSQLTAISDSESGDDEEFFDAVDAGEVEVVQTLKTKHSGLPALDSTSDLRVLKRSEIEPSFEGYEDPVRERLNMEVDNRPRISLWVSMLHLVRSGKCLLTRLLGNP